MKQLHIFLLFSHKLVILIPLLLLKHNKCTESMTSTQQSSYDSKIPYVSGNVFQKIIAGEIPSYKVFETEHAVAILDAFPTVKGHCLLLPKVQRATVMDLTESEAAGYLSQIPKLCRIVQVLLYCPSIKKKLMIN